MLGGQTGHILKKDNLKDTLLSITIAVKSRMYTLITKSVFQAETGFGAFSKPCTVGCHDVIVRKHLHAVIVPAEVIEISIIISVILDHHQSSSLF